MLGVSPLTDALHAYGLDGARCTPMPGTTRNDAWVVEPSDGRRLVLRRCRRNPDPARIELQIGLQRRLAEAGTPTPRVHATLDGRDLVVTDGTPWFLSDHVEGTHYAHGDTVAAAAAGRCLAEVHAAWTGPTEPDVEAPASWSGRAWWREGVAVVERLAPRFEADAAEEVEFLRAFAAHVAAPGRRTALDDLPVGWIHGDYHGRNLLFRRHDVAAVLDFDVCHVDALVFDLARALNDFGRPAPRSLDRRHDTARAFLDGYDDVRSLTPGERDVLPEAVAVTCLRGVAYYAMVERDGQDALEAFRRHVATATACRAQEGVLRAVATP